MHRDSLGDRMKEYYEVRTKYFLPRRTYTIIRIDGKSFHSYTRNCKRPYDLDLMEDLDNTALALCNSIDSVKLAYIQSDEISLLLFDSRVFTIPDSMEVENYFIWRGQDCTRNPILMTAHTYIEYDRLQGKSSKEMQEMLWQEQGVNWNDLPDGFRRGRCIIKVPMSYSSTYNDGRTGEIVNSPIVERLKWKKVVPPIFTQDLVWLRSYIPKIS